MDTKYSDLWARTMHITDESHEDLELIQEFTFIRESSLTGYIKQIPIYSKPIINRFVTDFYSYTKLHLSGPNGNKLYQFHYPNLYCITFEGREE